MRKPIIPATEKGTGLMDAKLARCIVEKVTPTRDEMHQRCMDALYNRIEQVSRSGRFCVSLVKLTLPGINPYNMDETFPRIIDDLKAKGYKTRVTHSKLDIGWKPEGAPKDWRFDRA